MGKFYEKGRGEVVDLVDDIMKSHHSALYAHDVTVAVLFLGEYDKDGVLIPTLKHGGYQAAATIKATSTKDRCLGIADALLTIDLAIWKELSHIKKRALIDHEITHLELIPEAKGSKAMKIDDQGRPKLSMKLHDWQLGGFTSIARRYRDDALEVEAVRASRDENGQYFWDWSAIGEKVNNFKEIVERDLEHLTSHGGKKRKVDDCKISITHAGKTVETTMEGMRAAANRIG